MCGRLQCRAASGSRPGAGVLRLQLQPLFRLFAGQNLLILQVVIAESHHVMRASTFTVAARTVASREYFIDNAVRGRIAACHGAILEHRLAQFKHASLDRTLISAQLPAGPSGHQPFASSMPAKIFFMTLPVMNLDVTAERRGAEQKTCKRLRSTRTRQREVYVGGNHQMMTGIKFGSMKRRQNSLTRPSSFVRATCSLRLVL
jgi:hypothetical protein